MFDVRRNVFVLAALAALAACEDDGTGPDGGTATVQGRVEEVTPAPQAAAASGPSKAPGTDARTVAVVQIEADGDLTEIATAEAGADGSFTVEGVPAGRSDLAVVAYVEERAAGRVLIHEETRGDAVIVVAPIDYETTVEARSYGRLRAAGDADATSAAEVSLLLRMEGAEAEAVATSDAEVEAAAAGLAVAGRTMTAAYAEAGTDLDAAARAEALADAAVAFAAERAGGASAEAAHEGFAAAALDAFAAAGASPEATVVATAAAASTFDAALEGASSERRAILAQAIRLNLRARERLAASFSSGAEATIAADIEEQLGTARASVGASGTLAELGAALDAALDALIDLAADGAVELLAAEASAGVRAQVRAEAEAALETARLDARLASATTAEAAAAAMADYRSEVRAAVDEMIALAGETDVDADVVTSLFIAACAGAHVR